MGVASRTPGAWPGGSGRGTTGGGRGCWSSSRDNYPGVFTPDWIFGGKKYGWGLRFKKSKSFCTLLPERNRLLVQIVFGGEEREKAEKVLPELSPVFAMRIRTRPRIMTASGWP